MLRPTIIEILEARSTLRKYMMPTPLNHYPGLDTLLGANVYVKHENHTATAAFKLRGGINTVAQLSNEQKRRGVIVASSGNFGRGMAYAGRIFGVKTVVVMPEKPNPLKVAAIKALGAEVVLSNTIYDPEPDVICSMIKEFGYEFISDSEDTRFISGSGTIMLEILDQLPEVDIVILPVGGGGLASGICIAGKGMKPNIELIAVCSKDAPSPYLSWKDGQLIDAPMNTFAEGIGVKISYSFPMQIIRELLDNFVLVSDKEILEAMVLMLDKTHNLAEGAGGAPLAAARKMKGDLAGKNVVLIQSGGNAALNEINAALDMTTAYKDREEAG